MTPAQSPLSPRSRAASAWLSLALVLLVAAARPVLAQNGDVSGIPPGPANANGLNGVIRDPSGIGNAAKMPPLPQQIAPMTVPSAVPLTSTRPAYTPRLRYRPWRHLPKRERERLERAQVKENDRLLHHGATSICRGC
jgi:hypothetical protein